MASLCLNNVTVTQEFPSYACFNPRASFTREDTRTSSRSTVPEIQKQIEEEEEQEGDFEFSLVNPVGTLPADELFSDGKLVTTTTTTKIQSKETGLFCPKASRCSSKWRELFGLKRFSQTTKPCPNPRLSSSSSSLKQFLNRSSRSSSSSSSSDASLLNLPLLKDSDSESVSISSSRMSLSSSSSNSGHDYEESLPRLSLDNHTANPFAPSRSQNPNPPRMRLVNRVGRSPMRRSTESSVMSRGVSVDSPRLNSSGKIVFQSLERSSSSPSSFNGGTSGYRHRGMERSYSSNVRVTPVLNVPVCSIRGGSVVFGQFFSNGSINRASSSSSSSHGGIIRGRNSTDRI